MTKKIFIALAVLLSVGLLLFIWQVKRGIDEKTQFLDEQTKSLGREPKK